MDTSETYIKMCREAKEIQGWTYKTLKRDDYVVYGDDVVFADAVLGGLSSDIWTWLPRQDQLQEMINFQPVLSHLGYCKDLMYQLWELKKEPFQSWEQVWLSVVMIQKYNKTWNGETWDAL